MSNDETQHPYMRVERQGDVLNVTFTLPMLTEEENIDEVGHLLFSLVDDHHVRQVIVNLGQVQLLTSSVIGKMITLHRKLHRNQGHLVLCELTDRVRDVLGSSRLIDYFQITPDLQSAFARMSELVNNSGQDDLTNSA